MRILVVSDSHGYEKNLLRIITMVEPDLLVHCGDVENGESIIRQKANCPCYFVGGNNDFFSGLPKEVTFTAGPCKIWVTHGHRYGVHGGTDVLEREGRARGVQVVMFGHTHKPYLRKADGMVILNPGSVTYPRQEGRKPSYLVMIIEESGQVEYAQRFLED